MTDSSALMSTFFMFEKPCPDDPFKLQAEFLTSLIIVILVLAI